MKAKKAVEILNKHPCLYSSAIDLKEVQITADFLDQEKFGIAEIQKYPTSLLLNRITLTNRMQVLKECEFTSSQLMFLQRFVSIMNKNVIVLKAYKYIGKDQNIAHALAARLDMPVTLKPISETKTLKDTRKIVISEYLKERLQMTDEDLVKLWKNYPRLNHKSLDSIVEVLRLLEDQIGFTKEKIRRNGFLVHSCDENIKRILKEVPTIAGVNIRVILLKCPKIAMQNVKTLKETLEIFQEFEIPEDRILKCDKVLTLGSATIRDRLNAMSEIEEFKVLKSNPGILKLIHFQNKAKTRLEYLKELKVKCASIHILSHAADYFEKFAKSGQDSTKGNDLVEFLSNTFGLERGEVRRRIQRHPYWCNVPVTSVQAAIDYFYFQGFNDEEMKENLYLLLYPTSRIDQKLYPLVEWKSKSGRPDRIGGVPLPNIPKKKLLSLCLYFIEAEFHYSGNGVWEYDRSDSRRDFHSTSDTAFPESLKHSKGKRYGPAIE